MENLLQSFLNVGMMDIGENDEKFKNLQKASQDITKKLLKKKSDAIKYTLVALDPQIPVDEPVLKDVEGLVQKHWNTFKNRYPDTPRQIIRPVILEGLRAAGEVDIAVATIVWLTGSSYFPHANLGLERQVCGEFLIQMGGVAEAKAAQDWAINTHSQPLSLPTFETESSLNEGCAVDEKELTKQLTIAAGPTDAQNVATSPAINQYTPANGQAWTNIFIPHAAKSITSSVNKSLGFLLKNFSAYNRELIAELSNYLTSVNTALSSAVNSSLQGAAANGRRTSLLWWKETLYSLTLKRSYREVDAVTAVLLMAYDLHRQVPEYCPQSVDYLLREAFCDVSESVGERANGITLAEFCDQLANGSESSTLNRLFSIGTHEQDRGTLLTLIKETLSGLSREPDDLPRRVGLKEDSRIDLGELAVWCFHDMQAQRLASVK